MTQPWGDRQPLRDAHYREADTRRMRRWAILSTAGAASAVTVCASLIAAGAVLGVVSYTRQWAVDLAGPVAFLLFGGLVFGAIAASELRDSIRTLTLRFANHRAAKRALLDLEDRYREPGFADA